MIRVAKPKDAARCLEMGRAFYEESGLSEFAFDPDTAAQTIARLMLGDDCVLLVSDVDGELLGMAAAIAYPHYMNALAKVAQEMFWWVDPKARGGMSGVRMLSALEAWARGRGCVSLTMICLPIDSPAETIYARFGYRPLERSFVKRMH